MTSLTMGNNLVTPSENLAPIPLVNERATILGVSVVFAVCNARISSSDYLLCPSSGTRSVGSHTETVRPIQARTRRRLG